MPFDAKRLAEVEALIERTTINDLKKQLERLRLDVQQMRSGCGTIKPRNATGIAIIATDGGNNRLSHDFSEMQFVRVVDSYGEELCLDAISPWSDPREISARQFGPDGKPITALGKLMSDLGVTQIGGPQGLSGMIPQDVPQPDREPDKVWTMVYRDLCEWAVIYERIMSTTFAGDTLLIRDGLLREKIFRTGLFSRIQNMLEEKMREVREKKKRRLFLVGVAKRNKVVELYTQAMMLEEIFPEGSPCFVKVPQKMEERAYEWPKYARTQVGDSAGSLYLVRFGTRLGDRVWPVDVFTPNAQAAEEILGCLLEDAKAGFPMPFYPLSLQRADNFAQVTDMDHSIIEKLVYKKIRSSLPESKRAIFDQSLFTTDIAARRYS